MRALIILSLVCSSAGAAFEPPALPDDRCTLESMPENQTQCPRERRSDFLQDVESSLNEVIKRFPEFFDLDDQPVPGQPRVINGPEYHYAVVAALNRRGYCAIPDDKFEEIGVKRDNGLNEQFDLFRGDGYVRRGIGAYRASCRPAAF